MTRFARSKGSKASNEKAPEDSTPWEVMKEQLLRTKKEKDEYKKIEEAEKQRIQNYENFLKEQKTQKRKAIWCDFPETQEGQSTQSPTKKKKKNKSKQITENNDKIIAYSSNNIVVSDLPIQKEKIKKKNLTQIHNENKETDTDKEILEETVNNSSGQETLAVKKKKKNKKNKTNQTTIPSSNPLDNNQKLQTEEKKGNNTPKQPPKHKKKNKTLVNGKVVRRKDINDNSFQLIINGKEVELVRVDGFPVMKKDAERLHELKANMLQKGIPKSEIQRTMKLERRRAEKALARLKREVCYNCRKGGQNLSDCLDL